MKALGIIPARYDSTRFPGKPLFVIDGKSMIRRVYEQASRCVDLDKVVVATDHQGILNHVHDFGGSAVMTSPSHPSGTDRCAEALGILKREEGLDPDIVVNIQGDEPYIHPEQISQLVACFTNPSVGIATLARRISSPEEISDPNVVKLVLDLEQFALYFSRAPIPFAGMGSAESDTGGQVRVAFPWYKHVGIYGFRRDLLPRLVELPGSPLEKTESLEQLRWLQHGFRIYVRETTYESISIDTPSDVLKISARER